MKKQGNVVQRRLQTPKEELFNFLTHGVGAVLGVVGLVVLVVGSVHTKDPWRIVSLSIYGISLVLLYTASAMYHFQKDEAAKKKLKVFDHASIYLLIAGTYTPFSLVTINGPWGY